VWSWAAHSVYNWAALLSETSCFDHVCSFLLRSHATAHIMARAPRIFKAMFTSPRPSSIHGSPSLLPSQLRDRVTRFFLVTYKYPPALLVPANEVENRTVLLQ
jgi:hypothetical protein